MSPWEGRACSLVTGWLYWTTPEIECCSTGIVLYSEYRLAFPAFNVSVKDNILLYMKSVWLTLLEFTNITMSAIHLEHLTLLKKWNWVLKTQLSCSLCEAVAMSSRIRNMLWINNHYTVLFSPISKVNSRSRVVQMWIAPFIVATDEPLVKILLLIIALWALQV